MTTNGIKAAINLFGSQKNLANKLGLKPQNLQVWISGKRSIPPKRCVQIEKLTNGAVTRKDLRPNDWHEIWVELLDKPTDPAQ